MGYSSVSSSKVKVIFSHPRITRALTIRVNPDQVTWAYGLNTASYPTYGGEVVQILSVYFDDMTIAGTVATVAELEEIYGWFILYMQYATQGRYGASYDQHPVKFEYPERDWTFFIWPKSLPAFQYGRDVVAPQWQLTAAVKEPSATLAQQIQSLAAFNAANTGTFDVFGKATADFGTSGDLITNPFASPDGSFVDKSGNVDEKKLSAFTQQQAQKLGDSYNKFVNNVSAQDYSQLFPDASKPPNLTQDVPANKQKNAKKTTKKKK